MGISILIIFAALGGLAIVACVIVGAIWLKFGRTPHEHENHDSD